MLVVRAEEEITVLMIDMQGRKWICDVNGRKRPYRWYHALRDGARELWHGRHWRRRQREFKRTGTRYYGNGGTIHGNTELDIEIGPDGKVVAVWFRCQPLPYRAYPANAERAADMRRMYQEGACKTKLCGVEVKDPPRGKDGRPERQGT